MVAEGHPSNGRKVWTRAKALVSRSSVRLAAETPVQGAARQWVASCGEAQEASAATPTLARVAEVPAARDHQERASRRVGGGWALHAIAWRSARARAMAGRQSCGGLTHARLASPLEDPPADGVEELAEGARRQRQEAGARIVCFLGEIHASGVA